MIQTARTAKKEKRTMLSPREVGKRYGVCAETVTAWIKAGHLSAIIVSPNPASRKPRYRVNEEDLKAFERRRQVQPPAPAATRKRKSNSQGKEYF